MWNDYPVPHGTFRENLLGHRYLADDHYGAKFKYGCDPSLVNNLTNAEVVINGDAKTDGEVKTSVEGKTNGENKTDGKAKANGEPIHTGLAKEAPTTNGAVH